MSAITAVIGRNSINKLELLLNSIHKTCPTTCSKDSNCLAEKNLSEETEEKLQQLREEVKDYREHKEVADHQAAELSRRKNALKEGECLVVEDFAGRFLIKAELELSQEDYFARKGVPDLILFVYYREGNEIKYQSFDIISKRSEKDDFGYVRSAWLHLLNENSFF